MKIKRYLCSAAALVALVSLSALPLFAADPAPTSTAPRPRPLTSRSSTSTIRTGTWNRINSTARAWAGTRGSRRSSTRPGPSGKAARVFLVHAGDEFSRGDELTRATKGAANVAIMNLLKFDLWVPGNGEFYQPLDVLEARLSEAKFPILAANVKYREGGKPVGKPYIIEKAGPVRIAFLGLGIVQPTEAPSAADVLMAADPIETAKGLVPELRKQADVVVAVTHIGSPADRRLAAAVPGIDVILGGHTHDTFPKGVPIKGPDGRERPRLPGRRVHEVPWPPGPEDGPRGRGVAGGLGHRYAGAAGRQDQDGPRRNGPDRPPGGRGAQAQAGGRSPEGRGS